MLPRETSSSKRFCLREKKQSGGGGGMKTDYPVMGHPREILLLRGTRSHPPLPFPLINQRQQLKTMVFK